MTPIAPHITAFLRERITCENTRVAYAYAFQLLFAFASRRLGVTPSEIQIEHIDASLVLAFLDHIQRERGNGARSRNTRLAAVRSFMHFIEYRVPAALDQIQRVLAIPLQRTDTRLVKHLSATESRAVLDAPDPASRLGIRDRAMLYLALTGGLRVSELVGLRLDNVRFDGRYVEICVLGKGRKERALLLWKEVGDAIRAWLAIRGTASCPELFLAATAHPMSRSGFEYVLRKHVAAAAVACPSLAGRSVSPHTLRHYAESPVMPSCPPLHAGITGTSGSLTCATRHNQRLCRKARSLSSGWKRAGRAAEGAVLASARSLSWRLAAK